MLTTRHGDSELSHPWSFNKLDTTTSSASASSYPRTSSPPSSRMSNTGFETPLSNATEWSGQYSFLPPAEPIFASQPYDHHVSAGAGDQTLVGGGGGSTNGGAGAGGAGSTSAQNTTRPSTSSNGDGSSAGANSGATSRPKDEPGTSPLGLHHRHSIDPLGLRQQSTSVSAQGSGGSSTQNHSSAAPASMTAGQDGSDVLFGHKGMIGDDGTGGSSGAGGGGDAHGQARPLGQPLHAHHSQNTTGQHDDEDDLLDDEEMGDGSGEADAAAPAQTAA